MVEDILETRTPNKENKWKTGSYPREKGITSCSDTAMQTSKNVVSLISELEQLKPKLSLSSMMERLTFASISATHTRRSIRI